MVQGGAGALLELADVEMVPVRGGEATPLPAGCLPRRGRRRGLWRRARVHASCQYNTNEYETISPTYFVQVAVDVLGKRFPGCTITPYSDFSDKVDGAAAVFSFQCFQAVVACACRGVRVVVRFQLESAPALHTYRGGNSGQRLRLQRRLPGSSSATASGSAWRCRQRQQRQVSQARPGAASCRTLL